ncbi:hypothetical protein [Tahibacter caeni]|uniref:hypothetical protein n=1 Tax=Tahibacter caeni TaxID=1453545 RepID=UPI002147E27C|nr:hypothetical protein [Tahibacter caeni]
MQNQDFGVLRGGVGAAPFQRSCSDFCSPLRCIGFGRSADVKKPLRRQPPQALPRDIPVNGEFNV